MKSKQAEKLIEKIDGVIKDIDTFSDISDSDISDLEKSYLAKFLVVFICGIYEEIIENIINERVDKSNNIEISNYIKTSLRNSFRNPSIKVIKELLCKFNENWKLEISNLPQIAMTSMDNIVTNKNNIAHGNDTNITLEDITKYYNDSIVVIEKIDDMLL